ncbi:glycerophosphodiester phosphodiesterase [Cohnella faecalis]|uniref:glycerophosphodiester phosphodiesterase n=1 Tax=Cohnella faecalis TaxID=2315694 RepID=UPI002278C51C|nr:glycerophosphodiester phosphodiesterase family protein [Cohnella faecalis]
MRLSKLWFKLWWVVIDRRKWKKGMAAMTPEERSRLHPCVAHRGWSGAAPENTMAAFEMALREPNVNWMELDVHLSQDEVPVVIHDGTLKRTTNGKGKVMECTAEQLGKLDAGSWFSSSYAGEGVPTLAQVLELAAGRCNLNIELKDDGDDRRILAARTLETIRSRAWRPMSS